MRAYIPFIMPGVSVLPLGAQTDRATLPGVVTDPSRAVIPNPQVNLHSESTEIDRAASTNAAGVHSFTGMPVGGYTASISADVGGRKRHATPDAIHAALSILGAQKA